MSGRWRPLPDTLAPEVAYLVGLLRQLKDRTGLSLAALAARTPYSKSSWERYLNGIALPPRQAVEDLARVAGEPAARLFALWERAEAGWSGRTAGARTMPREPGEDPNAADPSGGRRKLFTAILVGAALAVAGLVVLYLVRSGGAQPSGSTAPDYSIGCRGPQCTGGEAQGMACGVDAASFAGLQVDTTYLELRISDQCAAAWARVSHAALGDEVSVADRDGRTETITVSDPAAIGQYLPTPMIAADRHSRVRACLMRGGERRCTDWGTP
ncbi:helix-turn-helix domain-containing protein [Amycolatopsis pithecellobii]|uniref:DUF2690 domain-containing protein n=1 Tax=Amycolatopsis pithecellobii TaxID=664692 RepID=A0A6N7Z4U9_9PSEU|nr:XRE family transcriptional regulator [Amycolatopsis pithecellobii]MTD54316.1 DUF2690 domain-containing protein [Amycolatopsis pithecellobii]